MPARLEITAVAKGLVPKLEQLVDIAAETKHGFTVKNIDDRGLSLLGLDATDGVAPLSERSWTVDLEPVANRSVREFVFPTLRAKFAAKPASADAPKPVTYEHYEDADVVDCAATVPLTRPVSPAGLGYWLVGIALALTGAIGYGTWRWNRRLQSAKLLPRHATYHSPQRLTPFTLLLLLKRIAGDVTLRLSPADAAELSQTIARLEQRHFAGQDSNGDSLSDRRMEHDLRPVLDHWLAIAAPESQLASVS